MAEQPLPLPAVPFGDGGKGTDRPDPADVALARRAINERWPIAPDQRASIVEWLVAVVGTTPDDRARVNAARALIQADVLNLEQEKRDLAIPDRAGVTTGGKPLPTAGDLKGVADAGLVARIAALEGRAGAAAAGPGGGVGGAAGGGGPPPAG